MMVYVMSSGRHLKIGISGDPLRRQQLIGQNHPLDVKLLATVGPYDEEEARDVERKLLNAFDGHRARGEWFDICPQILSLAAHMKRTGKVPARVLARGSRRVCEIQLAREEARGPRRG